MYTTGTPSYQDSFGSAYQIAVTLAFPATTLAVQNAKVWVSVARDSKLHSASVFLNVVFIRWRQRWETLIYGLSIMFLRKTSHPPPPLAIVFENIRKVRHSVPSQIRSCFASRICVYNASEVCEPLRRVCLELGNALLADHECSWILTHALTRGFTTNLNRQRYPGGNRPSLVKRALSRGFEIWYALFTRSGEVLACSSECLLLVQR
jgi:hypothetical protein